MVKPRVLIADDEAPICSLLKAEFETAGAEVDTARDGRLAWELYQTHHYDFAVLDINMPQMDGLELLREIKRSQGDTLVVIMTAYGSISGAVSAMKMHADDYIVKPFSPAELVEKYRQMMEVKNKTVHLSRAENSSVPVLLGQSHAMEQVRRKIEKVKDLNTTVLVTGESGTGKGVVAKNIHYGSNRSKLPFVHIDCASLPHNLIESELFGHEKGAFTNASAQRKGKLELAGKGTIFLDEISTLSPELQSKLLIVLQERKFERLGGTQRLSVEARIIAATNEDLEAAVNNGSFRADLFYRLNIVCIEMPPLRYRRSDIPELARYFVERHVQNTGVPLERVDDDVWEALSEYDWPGNVRELENTLESAVVLSDGHRLTVKDLPQKILANRTKLGTLGGMEPSLSLEHQEIMTILAALEKHGGHREKTAKELGISRRTLQYKLAKYHLTK